MKNPNDYNLIVFVNEQIDDSVAQEIEKSVEQTPDTLIVPVPSQGPQASLLLIGITAIAVKIGEGFLSKIGEIAAEKALGGLMGAIKEAQEEPVIITAGGIIKGETNGFSLHHSMVFNLSNGATLKCLFKANWTMSEFNKAVIIYNRELRKYRKNEQNQISNIQETHLPYAGFLPITVDLENETIIHVSI